MSNSAQPLDISYTQYLFYTTHDILVHFAIDPLLEDYRYRQLAELIHPLISIPSRAGRTQRAAPTVE